MMRSLVSRTRRLRYGVDRLLYRMFGDGEAIEELRAAYGGRPMLVIGNGPSLNRTPLDDFVGTPSIGMNKIDLLFPRVRWRPSMIVCANSLVVKQHADAFKTLDIPVFLSWKSRWFVRGGSRNGNLRYYLSLPDYQFSRNIVDGVGVGGTVTFDALQFAYFMGADPVILFGVDHNFQTSDKPAHYVKRTGPDSNHFDPNYFKAGSYWGVPDLARSEQAYASAREAFEDDGRRVLDATIGGRLEIFERIDVNAARELVGR